jgi:tetratricopeptide (TPR) repeat protein
MHHRYAGRLDEAASAYRRAQQCRDAPDPAILHNLASLAHLRGELDNAEQLIRSALKLRGPDQLGRSADTAVLTAILGDAGRFTAAEREYDRARNMLINQQAAGSIELLYLDANRIVLLHGQGRLVDADALAATVFAATQAALGREHPQTGVVLTNWARVAAALGDNRRAGDFAAEAVRVLQAQADETLPALFAAREMTRQLPS